MLREAGGAAAMFDLKLSYISTQDGGENLRAVSRIVHAGRRTIVTECRIETSDGRLVATASGTFAVTRDREERK